MFKMHGVPDGKHAFLKMTGDSYFPVAKLAGIEEIPGNIGVSHAGTGAGKCARGLVPHIAFRAPDEDGLIAQHNRIRSQGLPAIRPIGLDLCNSLYFAGPEGLTLEVACAVSDWDPARRADPKCWKNDAFPAWRPERRCSTRPAPPRPAPPRTATGPVPKPTYDPARSQLAYPPEP